MFWHFTLMSYDKGLKGSKLPMSNPKREKETRKIYHNFLSSRLSHFKVLRPCVQIFHVYIRLTHFRITHIFRLSFFYFFFIIISIHAIISLFNTSILKKIKFHKYFNFINFMLITTSTTSINVYSWKNESNLNGCLNFRHKNWPNKKLG